MKKRILRLLAVVLAAALISVSAGYLFTAQRIRSSFMRERRQESAAEEAAVHDSAALSEIAPRDDFSADARPVIDTNGYLMATDNSLITDVSVSDIRTKYFSFSIPGAWAGHCVIRCRYINDIYETDADTGAARNVVDTYLLSIYEKNNYASYREYYRTHEEPSAVPDGKLTELRFTSSENDTDWLKTSTYYSYAGDVEVNGKKYELYFYEPHSVSEMTNEENAALFGYMISLPYERCMVHSFRGKEGSQIIYPDEETKKGYEAGWNPEAEGIPRGSSIPETVLSTAG